MSEARIKTFKNKARDQAVSVGGGVVIGVGGKRQLNIRPVTAMSCTLYIYRR